MPTNLSVLLTN